MLKDLESNAQWNSCIDINGASLGRCVNDCQNESECENSCLDVFKAQQLNCPCEVGQHECILNNNLYFRKTVLPVAHVMSGTVKNRRPQRVRFQQLLYLKRPCLY